MYKFKTQDIKGKAYVPVNERIKYLDIHYRGKYSLTSEVNYMPEIESWLCKAVLTITNDDGTTQSYTGHASEVVGKGMVNSTSALENAETSAWGRVCSAAGIGIETSIASFEEVENAIKVQDNKEAKPAAKKDNPPVPLKKAKNLPATTKQKTELMLRVNHKLITHAEKTKMLENINDFTKERIEKSLANLKQTIAEREAKATLA